MIRFQEFAVLLLVVTAFGCTQGKVITGSQTTAQVGSGPSTTLPTINGGSLNSSSILNIEILPSGNAVPSGPSSSISKLMEQIWMSPAYAQTVALSPYSLHFFTSASLQSHLQTVLGVNYAALASAYSVYSASPSAGVPSSLTQSLTLSLVGAVSVSVTKPLSVWMNPNLAIIMKGSTVSTAKVYLGDESVANFFGSPNSVKLSAISGAKFLHYGNTQIKVFGGVAASAANRRNAAISLTDATQSFQITSGPSELPSSSGLSKYVVKPVTSAMDSSSSSFASGDVGTKILLAHAKSNNEISTFTVIDLVGNIAAVPSPVVCADVISSLGSPYTCPIIALPNTQLSN